MSDNLKPKKDNFVTHIRDLLSGRVYDTFAEIYEILLGRKGYGRRIQTLENIMNVQEEKILNAAQAVNSAAASLREYHEGMKAKFALLQQQAQAPVAAEEPVDFTEEFEAFDKAIEGLVSTAEALNGDSGDSETGSGDAAQTDTSSGQSPVVDNSTAQNPPFSPQLPTEEPQELEPTPLAGQSGVTNPMPGVEEGQVFAGQQQPGTSVPVSSEDDKDEGQDVADEDEDEDETLLNGDLADDEEDMTADEDDEDEGEDFSETAADTYSSESSADNVPKTEDQG